MNQHVDRADLRRTLAEWIERSRDVVGEEIRCIKIIHETSSDPVDVIPAREIPMTGLDAEDDPLGTFAEKLAQRIEADAAGFKGAEQQYYVELYRGNNAERSSGRLPCTVSILKGDRRGSSSKVTDEKGLIDLCATLAREGFGAVKDQGRGIQKLYTDALNREAGLRLEVDTMRGQLEEMRAIINQKNEQLASKAETREMVGELFKDARALAKVLMMRAAGDHTPLSELAPEQLVIREVIRELDGPTLRMVIAALSEKSPRVGILLGELILKTQGEDERRAGVRDAAKNAIADGKAKVKLIDEGKANHDGTPKVNGHASPHQLGSGTWR